MFTVLLEIGLPAIASILAGMCSILLGLYLLDHRGKPGVNWFLGVFVAQSIWCFSYGISLVIFDPLARTVFEAITWLGITWTGLTFIGFAIHYTGRGDIAQGWLFRGIVVFGIATSIIIATNGFHGLIWSDFRISSRFGLATVRYTFWPWAYLAIGVGTIAVAAGVFLLVDTIFSYGPLFRREALAVALSPVPPGVALLAWLFELGPVPELNLAAALFLPHIALDAYAFGRADMFERNPTTMRTAEQNAIDDLGDPILVLTQDGQKVRMNHAAMTMLNRNEIDLRDHHVGHVLGDEFPDKLADSREGNSGEINFDYDHRSYALSISPLTDSKGNSVGHIVVFQILLIVNDGGRNLKCLIESCAITYAMISALSMAMPSC